MEKDTNLCLHRNFVKQSANCGLIKERIMRRLISWAKGSVWQPYSSSWWKCPP